MPRLDDSYIVRHTSYLEFRFPGAGPKGPFMAISLAAAGSMTGRDALGLQNRQSFIQSLGITHPVHAQLQKHTQQVNDVSSAGAASPPNQEGDGLVLFTRPGFISVTAADCMPIYLWNSETGALALLHSGWKGTGILEKGVSRIARPGGTDSVKVLFGPSIGSCCYRVNPQRYRYFADTWGESAVRRDETGFYISLVEANRRIPEDIGLGSCFDYTVCTCCNTEFGSYRREGPEKFTSMLALSGYFQ